MNRWTGKGVYQWENSRQWTLNAASEFCRADGALVVPGFSSMSIFFRRVSQSAGTFELCIWTAPIYFKLLDDNIDTNTASQLLYKLTLQPGTGLQMTGTAAQVFGAKIATDQPMGSVLFWEIKNTVASGTLIGDIYVVPNATGSIAPPPIERTVDLMGGGGGVYQGSLTGAGGRTR